MTASQQTRFVCDACGHEAIQPFANSPAVTRGLQPPEDWTLLWIDDYQQGAKHLCPLCTTRFKEFMGEKS